MIKLGAHAFVWIGEWTTEAGNMAIREAGKEGFDLLEIPLLDPKTFDVDSHKKALQEAGITATCSLVLPKDAHMPTNPDGARAFLTEALDKVEALGSQYLAGCLAYHLGELTGAPPTDKERQTVIGTLGQVAEDANKRGITLALEACNRYETYLYNTLADTRDTIQAIGADNLKLHADTYHMNIEEEGFHKPFVATADVLEYVHMSESHRGLVGSGTVNWEEAWRGLKDADFDGYLVLESFAAVNPALAAATCLWRPPNESSEVLAKEGLKFLKEGAERHGLTN